MKLALVMTALATIATSSITEASKRTDEAAILRIEKGMAAAQTIDDIVKAWDKDVVWFDMLVPSQVTGIDAVRHNLGAQVNAVKNIHVDIESIQIQTGKDLAFAWSVQHIVAEGRNGGPKLDVVFRQTDCFSLKGGHWKLVHQHLSVPFDPVTGKSVFGPK